MRSGPGQHVNLAGESRSPTRMISAESDFSSFAPDWLWLATPPIKQSRKKAEAPRKVTEILPLFSRRPFACPGSFLVRSPFLDPCINWSLLRIS
jgi:hypothetical protein